ncbi:MAG TPA: uracil-DNA glycosylase [Spongiibacteraceae bacterium]|nr:uracil-DNA glycosylase [Spongiibacteraceae bacterium]
MDGQGAIKKSQIKLDTSWLRVLGDEFDKPYMVQLKAFLREEKQAGKVIYPAGDNWFNALNSTPFDKVKVVVLGQDPYHGPGQAHGLCFSVLPGVPTPPSLVNIFKELAIDLNIPISRHGYLQHWAEQGVLLLNAVLTVQHANANSHQGRGWEAFTDSCIEHLNREREHLVFLLWGSYAQKKGQLIDRSRHLVLTAPHPSPLSAHRGFLGCKHFSKANHYLQQHGMAPIDWALPQ